MKFQAGKLHPNYKRGFGIRKDGRVILRVNGKKILRARHNYMKYHNLEALPIGFEIHHKDGDPSNDSKENLELINARIHRMNHKLKDINTKTLIFYYKKGFSFRKIGRLMNIHHQTVKRHLKIEGVD